MLGALRSRIDVENYEGQKNIEIMRNEDYVGVGWGRMNGVAVYYAKITGGVRSNRRSHLN